jgi:hypothetical protein
MIILNKANRVPGVAHLISEPIINITLIICSFFIILTGNLREV